MGVRQRVVRQTITEVVCDLCKKPVEEDSAHVGTLSVKPSGARGRPRQLEVAFHADCYKRLSGTAVKSRSGSKKAAKRSTGARKKAAKRPRKKTAKRSTGARKKATSGPSAKTKRTSAGRKPKRSTRPKAKRATAAKARKSTSS